MDASRMRRGGARAMRARRARGAPDAISSTFAAFFRAIRAFFTPIS
jgi:hypothetical protein